MIWREQVIDQKGNPRPSLGVRIVDVNAPLSGMGWTRSYAEGITDVDGFMEFDLEPGDYDVHVAGQSMRIHIEEEEK